MRPLALLFVALGLAGLARGADSPVAHARAIAQLLADAVGPHSAGFLGQYAEQRGADPDRFEPFTEAARRLATGGDSARQAPDITALHLERHARALLAAPDATAADRIAAHRARFHARRIVAAVHYNLFKRTLRLAELVAATYREKDAVAAWRDLVAVAESVRLPELDAFRADLKQFEASFKELEEQCCPPDDAILRERVWQPATQLPKA